MFAVVSVVVIFFAVILSVSAILYSTFDKALETKLGTALWAFVGIVSITAVAFVMYVVERIFLA